MLTRITLFVFSLCLLACSTNDEAGSGLPDLDNTEAGVGAGALIGAGVGALVGSTAGEAGAGVVLGSIAGATSGGLIGKAIDGQERRIDQHDQKAGLNTKKKTSARGSLADTIWSSSNSNSNRPSGSKGRAAKFVEPLSDSNSLDNDLISPPIKTSSFTQVKQERIIPSVPKTVSANSKYLEQPTFISRKETSSAGLPVAKSPTIELQKPKPELPVFSGPTVRKPTLGDSTGTLKTARIINPPVSDDKKIIVAKETPKAKLAEPEIKKSIEKTETITNKVSSLDGVKQEVSTATSTKIETAKVNAPVKAAVASVCESGQKDFDRAKKSASDSDKVFYLRRVILACPKNTDARVQLGQVYSRLGLKDEAKKEFKSVLESDPENESAQDEMSIMMLDSRKN